MVKTKGRHVCIHNTVDGPFEARSTCHRRRTEPTLALLQTSFQKFRSVLSRNWLSPFFIPKSAIGCYFSLSCTAFVLPRLSQHRGINSSFLSERLPWDTRQSTTKQILSDISTRSPYFILFVTSAFVAGTLSWKDFLWVAANVAFSDPIPSLFWCLEFIFDPIISLLIYWTLKLEIVVDQHFNFQYLGYMLKVC